MFAVTPSSKGMISPRTLSVTSVGVLCMGLAACGPPLSQRTAPYPAYGQPWERMSQDSMQCDSWARANAGSQGDAAAGGAVGGALVGAAVGAGLGAIAGSFFGMADSGAAIGAAMGGASGGLQGAADSAVAQDQRLMAAYRNCMAARGYVVDGSVPPPMPAAASVSHEAAEPAPERSRTVEVRLLELQRLKDDGLISVQEYKAHRRVILEDL